MAKLVTYTGNGEVIVMTKKKELLDKEAIFTVGTRDVDDYERAEHIDAFIIIRAPMQVR